MKKKKYKIEEHIFANLRPYRTAIVEYVDNDRELLSLPWIKAAVRKHQCNRFTVSSDEEIPNTKILIIENDDCTYWWAVAFLPKDYPTELPTFTRELPKS